MWPLVCVVAIVGAQSSGMCPFLIYSCGFLNVLVEQIEHVELVIAFTGLVFFLAIMRASESWFFYRYDS